MKCCFMLIFLIGHGLFFSLKTEAELRPLETDSFFDPEFDYSSFSGRVTDRDETSSIVKISSENKNVRYFRAGDVVEFKIQAHEKREPCLGFVRALEEGYFVLFVKDLFPCLGENEYFRRGTILVMKSQKLQERVKEASIYRLGLVVKKRDFLKQLNDINNDIWNFDYKKAQLAAEYDKKIAELEKEKIKSLEILATKRVDQVKLQKELFYRLDGIEKEMSFYRIDNGETFVDRWHLDKNLGLPVYERPEKLRPPSNH